jgi:hypothetical protein
MATVINKRAFFEGLTYNNRIARIKSKRKFRNQVKQYKLEVKLRSRIIAIEQDRYFKNFKYPALMCGYDGTFNPVYLFYLDIYESLSKYNTGYTDKTGEFITNLAMDKKEELIKACLWIIKKFESLKKEFRHAPNVKRIYNIIDAKIALYIDAKYLFEHL